MGIRSFLSLVDTSKEEMREVLDLARAHEEGSVSRTLVGKSVCLAFFESSTRTAVSFELAARRCGADVISLAEKVRPSRRASP